MFGEIYFDNNATTMMSLDVCNEMIRWCNHGNPSSSYKSAIDARKMLKDFQNYILSIYIGDCNGELGNHKVIFTSGASEANCTVLSSTVASWAWVHKSPNKIPNIIISSIEHKSLWEMAGLYEERGIATITTINPTSSGHIRPEDVETALIDNPNTCIVVCMHANNESGAINDINRIGQIAHKYGVVYHCDTVQTFTKIAIDSIYVDSIAISFHKLGGPPGVGALIIRKKLLSGWKLPPLIFGTQNDGHRGGTENLPGLGASYMALTNTMKFRGIKNDRVHGIKKWIMTELGRVGIPVIRYTKYIMREDGDNAPVVEIVFISGDDYYLHNTLLLSVVKRNKPYICNQEIRDDLCAAGVIVSVGSACNTSSPKASHVLYAMNADKYIRKGALRISLGDNNTLNEGKKFVPLFINAVAKQLKKR